MALSTNPTSALTPLLACGNVNVTLNCLGLKISREIKEKRKLKRKDLRILKQSEVFRGETLEAPTTPILHLLNENRIKSENLVAKLLRSISRLQVRQVHRTYRSQRDSTQLAYFASKKCCP